MNNINANTLKISVSGIRGIVNGSLSESLVKIFCSIYADYVGRGKIVVGRDTRQSGLMYKDFIVSALVPLGCEVVDLGICPTPTLLLMVRQLKANGGIMITASHNPIEWNGLKFADSRGLFLNEKQLGEVLAKFEKEKTVAGEKYQMGELNIYTSAIESHLNIVTSYLDKKLIRDRKFDVALDPCNGTGAVTTPLLLKELGCSAHSINAKPDGLFAHMPEPIPANLGDLCKLVKSKKADIGFAQDPDADRLVVVDNNGVCISEEYTLALVVDYILSKKKGNVVVNMSTSRVIDDIAEKYKVRLFRSKVGESNVVEKMITEHALIGGEGNGGVIFPELNMARDSIVGIGLILQYMAESGKSISELVLSLPQYKILKSKIDITQDKIPALLEKIKNKYSKENLNLEDGIKINYARSWVHIRASNTEPVVRIISEASIEQEAAKLINQIKEAFKC